MRDQLLMIEDDDDFALVLGRIVAARWSADVTRCADLRSGIQAVESNGFVAALVDLGLPDANGLEVVETLLEADPDLPIVVLTGQDDNVLAASALEAGAQDYLVKGDVSGDAVARALRHSVTRAATEADLRLRTEQLETSNADLSEFSAAVAHDLRAPVRTARMLVDRLVARVENPDHVTADLAGRIDESLARLDRTVLGLLKYSMVRDRPLGLEPVDLGRIVRSTVEALRADLIECGAEVDVGPLPTVLGHPDLVATVVQNLLENSVKYRRANVPLRISVVAVDVSETMACLEVSDNGQGIDEDNREQVFNLLERLHGHQDVPGLGLGLAMCRRIVTRLGGRIWIDDAGPPGLTVRMTLRVASGSDHARWRRSSAMATSSSTGAGRAHR